MVSARDDVFWGEDEREDGEHLVAQASILRKQEEFETMGYRDGLDIGKDSTLQHGFDQGFSLGIDLCLRLGEKIGALKAIEDIRTLKGEEANESIVELLKELNNVTSQDAFERENNTIKLSDRVEELIKRADLLTQ
ncbi:hypothetical protein AYI68_g7840 [Smittium mucronatum]|uniref:Protein YAE1 n=1 Tax=Smittium mucronatum TaxID=133383 RepID=A0A1R0GMM2_9FUNG|nr:hypothetical protein AYI68_g7840 [Smittium mucronatum]